MASSNFSGSGQYYNQKSNDSTEQLIAEIDAAIAAQDNQTLCSSYELLIKKHEEEINKLKAEKLQQNERFEQELQKSQNEVLELRQNFELAKFQSLTSSGTQTSATPLGLAGQIQNQPPLQSQFSTFSEPQISTTVPFNQTPNNQLQMQFQLPNSLKTQNSTICPRNQIQNQSCIQPNPFFKSFGNCQEVLTQTFNQPMVSKENNMHLENGQRSHQIAAFSNRFQPKKPIPFGSSCTSNIQQTSLSTKAGELELLPFNEWVQKNKLKTTKNRGNRGGNMKKRIYFSNKYANNNQRNETLNNVASFHVALANEAAGSNFSKKKSYRFYKNK